jgi:hypothetical protein
MRLAHQLLRPFFHVQAHCVRRLPAKRLEDHHFVRAGK